MKRKTPDIVFNPDYGSGLSKKSPLDDFITPPPDLSKYYGPGSPSSTGASGIAPTKVVLDELSLSDDSVDVPSYLIESARKHGGVKEALGREAKASESIKKRKEIKDEVFTQSALAGSW